MADYIIGASLFLIATLLLFYAINRLRESPNQTVPDSIVAPVSSPIRPNSFYPRLVVLLLIAVLGCYRVGHAIVRERQISAAGATTNKNAPAEFPKQIGAYTLVRSWNETLIGGPVIFDWAEYAPANGGTHISIGISPVLGSHDTLICHSARGEDPLWHDQLALTTATETVSFSGSFYNNGATQSLEATTLCNGIACGEYSSPTHFGFVYSKPDAQAIFSQDPVRPIPILIRAETIETTILPDVARQQMTAAIRAFTASVNLNSLTQPYRRT
jgi:exosortase J